MFDSHNGKTRGLYCSFCGKHQDEVRKLIAGPPQKATSQPVYICNECVVISHEILDREVLTESREFLTPREIYDIINQYVIGQDQTKRSVSVAVHAGRSDAGQNPRRPLLHRRRHHSDRGGVRRGGRGEHHPQTRPECQGHPPG